MPDWLIDFLGGPCYVLGNAIWSGAFSMMSGLLCTTPMTFSTSAWEFVVNTLYMWSLGVALAFLNIFALIGYTREASNLKEQITIEMFAMMCLRLVITNVVFIKLLDIMQSFLRLSAELSSNIMLISSPTFGLENFDAGTIFFFCIFGVLYVLVSIVCSLIMLLAIYGRFLKLYMIVALAPIAMVTIAGGRGINNTAYTFIRSFIATCFETVVIVVALTVASKMMSSIDLGIIEDNLLSIVDGFGSAIQSMMIMILLTASVKGSESFIRKYFGL